MPAYPRQVAIEGGGMILYLIFAESYESGCCSHNNQLQGSAWKLKLVFQVLTPWSLSRCGGLGSQGESWILFYLLVDLYLENIIHYIVTHLYLCT